MHAHVSTVGLDRRGGCSLALAACEAGGHWPGSFALLAELRYRRLRPTAKARAVVGAAQGSWRQALLACEALGRAGLRPDLVEVLEVDARAWASLEKGLRGREGSDVGVFWVAQSHRKSFRRAASPKRDPGAPRSCWKQCGNLAEGGTRPRGPFCRDLCLQEM